MTSTCRLALAGCLALVWLVQPAAGQSGDGVVTLLDSMQAAIASSDRAAYARLLAPDIDAAIAGEIVDVVILPAATRAVVRERDREPIPPAGTTDGLRLMVEVFTEFGDRGQIRTYRLDLRQYPDAPGVAGTPWRIAAQLQLSSVHGLYRLTLNRTRQFAVRNLTVIAEDLMLTMPSGSAFVAEVESGITAVVLLGGGTMRFSARPDAERGQVRIFGGSEVLETAFSAAFLRVAPSDLDTHMPPGSLVEQPVKPADLGRAQEIFDDEHQKSFILDLNDLSRENWSLVPALGDFLAEVRTKKYRTLTYTRSMSEPEDITLFDRERHRNIAAYPSLQKLQSRGFYYNEDDLTDYDVLQYDISTSISPEREWLEGRARMRLRVMAIQANTLTFRLNEALVVRAVVADEFGRLLTLRVKGQNNFIVSLPEVRPRGSLVTLTVFYGGRLPPLPPDREAVALSADQAAAGQARTTITADSPTIEPEPRVVYTNRSWWYPQSEVTDYVTASIQVTVPAEFDVVATGDASPQNPVRVPASAAGDRARNRFAFVAGQPVRYLAVLVSRLAPVGAGTLHLKTGTDGASQSTPTASAASTARPLSAKDRDAVRPSEAGRPRAAGVFYDGIDLSVVANPRQAGRGRSMLGQINEIMGVYAGILDDAPYPSLTLALVDSELPGGHSPAYWAMLYQALPTTPFSWRGDPVNFDSFPEFFIAHELAHQYWGQAVGWKSYHEQWISEGFAQYFAALYAERYKGAPAFRDLMRQMRRSALERSDQGPIHLGYRLGHIQGDGRIFRAIVYNKGALVLHMLRRLVGDEAFFRGIRQFYRDSRFRKVGTDDLQRTFEEITGMNLDRFFEGWVLESGIPTVRFRYEVEGSGTTAPVAQTELSGVMRAEGGPVIRLVFDQGDATFDFPVTVTLRYRSGAQQDVVLPVTGRHVEHRVPLRGPLRDLDVNADFGALARFERQ